MNPKLVFESQPSADGRLADWLMLMRMRNEQLRA